jgi:hypothetical protein
VAEFKIRGGGYLKAYETPKRAQAEIKQYFRLKMIARCPRGDVHFFRARSLGSEKSERAMLVKRNSETLVIKFGLNFLFFYLSCFLEVILKKTYDFWCIYVFFTLQSEYVNLKRS